MNTAQIINFCILALVILFALGKTLKASDISPETESEAFSAVRGLLLITLIGILLILSQLIMNFLFGGDMSGSPIPVTDVLLLRGVSLNFALALFGYMFIASVIGTAIGMLWRQA